VRGRFRTARWIGLLRSILTDPDAVRRNERLRALCALTLHDCDDCASIRFYRSTYSTVPADRGCPPLRRRTLHELALEPDGG